MLRDVFSKQDIVRRYALLEARIGAPLRLRHKSFFGRTAGENDFADPMALVERDGVVDALTEYRRRAFVPRRRTQHHCRIGMSLLRQGCNLSGKSAMCRSKKYRTPAKRSKQGRETGNIAGHCGF